MRRRLNRDLYTIPELVVMYCLWIHDDPEHPSKLWRVRMGRELRRVGARQVPECKRKTFKEEHRTMPQLWYLRSVPTVPKHLSTVGDVWEEYTLQLKALRVTAKAAAIASQGILASPKSASEGVRDVRC